LEDLNHYKKNIRVQPKISVAGKHMTTNLFDVTTDMLHHREEVKKLVEDKVDGEMSDQIELGLQSSQDTLGGVNQFSMAIIDLVQQQDRTSKARSAATSPPTSPSASPPRPTAPTSPLTKRPNLRRGGSYIPTPAELRGRRGLLNIKNHHDNDCFKYAICAAVHPTAHTKFTRHTAKNWRVHFDEFEWGDLEFPLHLSDITLFEDLNPTLAVNVLSWDSDRMIHVRERATTHTDRKTLWLMLLQDSGFSHYITIKDPRMFLGHGRKCYKHYCPTCWKQFSSKPPYETHLKNGCQVHGDHATDSVPSVDRGIKYIDWNNAKRTPQHTKYYVDFEACTVPIDHDKEDSTQLLGRQYIISYNIRCRRETGPMGPLWKTPIHCIRPSDMSHDLFITQFYNDLMKSVLENYNEVRGCEPLIMSKETRAWVKAKKKCCLCKEFFKNTKIQRHAHHDHETGKLVGAAHAKCNLDHNFEKVKFPVFMHNFTGYDSHLLLEGSAPARPNPDPLEVLSESSCFNGGKLNVIAQNSNRMKTITVEPNLPPASPGMKPPNIMIEFKDSNAFLNGSLESLVEALAKSDEKEFKVLKEHVRSLLPRNKVTKGFQLLLRKGVFPHSYIDSVERLKETCLPPIEAFHNDLKNMPCSPDDYEHAQTVWKFFRHKTLKDYHDLYLNCDTAQLADVMENFIKMCLDVYDIEPCCKIGAPGLFWDAMLKKTEQRLSMLTDLDMVHMYEKGTRGGVTYVASQYAKANNQHVPGFNKRLESSYIPYLDANSLYPWAMSQPLPYGRHKWIVDQTTLKRILAVPTQDTDSTGYTYEVDIHAPEEIHDSEADFPSLCEKRPIPLDQLSPHVSPMLLERRTERVRLLNHLLPTKNYVVDLRMLQYMVSKGYVVDKIHRAISFSQSKWMKPYIDSCVTKRQEAKRNGDSVRADFHKLSMNSVFGRTMENVRNRCDFRLVHNKEEITRLTNQHNYSGCTIIRPNSIVDVNSSLVGITMKKETVMLDKPLYIGSTILDLSKLRMHHFFDKLRKVVRCKLLYTDTDSLIIQVFCKDLYKLQAHPDLLDEFDFNKSIRNSNHHLPSVPGPMKLEPDTDCHLSEFVGLFPKGYACHVIGADSKPYINPKNGKPKAFKCTSKGFSMPSTQGTFQTYKDCLFNDTHTHVTETTLRASQNHIMYKQRQTRLGAYSSLGDKRYPLERNYQEGIFDSLPFGHYKNRPSQDTHG
jgi:hypothetical protein